MFNVIIVIHLVVCVLLILTVLIQSGRSSGLVESFSFAESILGTKTPKFMTRLTAILAGSFIVSCVLLSIITYQRSRSIVEKQVIKSPKDVSGEPKAEIPFTEEVQEAQKEIPAEEKAEDILPTD